LNAPPPQAKYLFFYRGKLFGLPRAILIFRHILNLDYFAERAAEAALKTLLDPAVFISIQIYIAAAAGTFLLHKSASLHLNPPCAKFQL
jgi:hypothetical protein